MPSDAYAVCVLPQRRALQRRDSGYSTSSHVSETTQGLSDSESEAAVLDTSGTGPTFSNTTTAQGQRLYEFVQRPLVCEEVVEGEGSEEGHGARDQTECEFSRWAHSEANATTATDDYGSFEADFGDADSLSIENSAKISFPNPGPATPVYSTRPHRSALSAPSHMEVSASYCLRHIDSQATVVDMASASITASTSEDRKFEGRPKRSEKPTWKAKAAAESELTITAYLSSPAARRQTSGSPKKSTGGE